MGTIIYRDGNRVVAGMPDGTTKDFDILKVPGEFDDASRVSGPYVEFRESVQPPEEVLSFSAYNEATSRVPRTYTRTCLDWELFGGEKRIDHVYVERYGVEALMNPATGDWYVRKGSEFCGRVINPIDGQSWRESMQWSIN